MLSECRGHLRDTRWHSGTQMEARKPWRKQGHTCVGDTIYHPLLDILYNVNEYSLESQKKLVLKYNHYIQFERGTPVETLSTKPVNPLPLKKPPCTSIIGIADICSEQNSMNSANIFNSQKKSINQGAFLLSAIGCCLCVVVWKALVEADPHGTPVQLWPSLNS